MSCNNPLHFNIDSIVRSVAVVAVGLPLTLSITNLTNTTARVAELALAKQPAAETIDGLRSELTRPCIDFYVSKVDGKLERTAKNQIDEVMGGEVDYRAICDYILS